MDFLNNKITYFILVAIVYFIINRSNKNTNIQNDRPLNREYLDRFIDYLRKHTPIAKKDFVLPYTFEKEMKETFYSRRSMQATVNYILDYLRVNNGVNVIVNFSTDLSGRQAGNYHLESNIREITINIKENYSFVQVMAIIAHECSHHFMFQKHLEFTDNKQNEMLTDIAAIYLGFGYYLSNAYGTKVKTKQVGYNMYQQQVSSLGYLNEKEVKYVYKQIQKIRKEAIERNK